MLVILLTLLALVVILSLTLMAYQIYTALLQPGAIYFPTRPEAVADILRLARLKSTDTLVDLGSGDGRILLAAARLGIKSIGYEIDPILVWRSRRLVHQNNLDHLAQVRWQSFWKADLSQTTVITVYLMPHLMAKLHCFLQKKPHPPLRLISNRYPIPKLSPVQVYHHLFLYRYKKY